MDKTAASFGQNVDLAQTRQPMFITVAGREIVVMDAKPFRAMQDAALSARPADSDMVERVAGFRTLSIHKGKQIVIEYDDQSQAGRVFDALVKTMDDGGADAQSAAE